MQRGEGDGGSVQPITGDQVTLVEQAVQLRTGPLAGLSARVLDETVAL